MTDPEPDPETYVAHDGRVYPWPPPTGFTKDDRDGRWYPPKDFGPTLGVTLPSPPARFSRVEYDDVGAWTATRRTEPWRGPDASEGPANWFRSHPWTVAFLVAAFVGSVLMGISYGGPTGGRLDVAPVTEGQP